MVFILSSGFSTLFYYEQLHVTNNSLQARMQILNVFKVNNSNWDMFGELVYRIKKLNNGR